MKQFILRTLKLPAILICGSLVGFVTALTSVGAQEPQWRYDYNAGLREAAEKKRPVLLEISTEGCLWCKKLEATTLRDPSVVKVLNDYFIPIKLDGQKNSIQIHGQPLKNYPTLIYLAPDSNILGVQEGYLEAFDFYQQAQKVVAGLYSSTPNQPQVAQQNPGHAAKKTPNQGFQADMKIGLAESRDTFRASIRNSRPNGQPFQPQEERVQRARELLLQAQEDFRRQQWTSCLDRCKTLAYLYPDLNEAVEARQMTGRIKSDPELLQRLTGEMTDQLAELYWELAQYKLRHNQTSQGIGYLEKILQACPETRYATAAQEYLNRLRPSTTNATSYGPKNRLQY